MGVVSRGLDLLARVDLGHAADSATPQTRVLVAVAPAVDCALDQTSLAAKAGVEFSKSPSNSVALSLVDQAIAAILVFATASARVDAVLGLELGA